jgi:hypothetical protein
MTTRRIRGSSLGLLVLALLASAARPATTAAASAGWLDPAFGTGGVAWVPKANADVEPCIVRGLAVATTGRIFVGVTSCDPEFETNEVTAFTPVGHVDPGFHAGRPVTVGLSDGIGTFTLVRPFATSDGGLLAKVVNRQEPCDYALRYTRTGTHGSPFQWPCMPGPPGSVNGPTTLLPGGSLRTCLRPDGSGKPAALTGLTPAGEIDTRIAPAGFRTLPIGLCEDLVSDRAGHLYVVSRRWLPDGRAVVLVDRLTSAGAPDTRWGDHGRTTIEAPQRQLKPVTAVATADGALLVGLGMTNSLSRSNWLAGVARLAPDGRVDPAFGTGGIATYAPDSIGSRLWALTVDSAGRPIVSVSVPTGTPTDRIFLMRGLASSGRPDLGFGSAGIVTLRRHALALAMAGPTRILLVSSVSGRLQLSARTN